MENRWSRIPFPPRASSDVIGRRESEPDRQFLRRRVLLFSLVILALAVPLAACSAPTATPPPFSRDQAIVRATQDAEKSVPEVGIQQARLDGVTAELITLGEADRRMGGTRGPGGYAPGQTPDSPAWWVSVRGYFRYEGMAFAPNPAPICEADERDFIYDARTGEQSGARIPNTRCASSQAPLGTATAPMPLASTATIVPVMRNLPTATNVAAPFLISPRQIATPTPTPNFLPPPPPSPTPTCPPPAPTLTAAPTSAFHPPAAGSLDSAFGSDGRVLSYNAGGAVALAIQADGKIVTVGSVPRIYASPSAFVLHRFNPDGSLDCPFGSNGTLVTNPFGDAHDVGAAAVALQADGKILLVGTVRNEKTGDDLALVRFNRDGSLDHAFGDGGQVSMDLDRGNDWPRAVAIQPDDRIIIAGRTTGGEHAADALSVARFLRDGSLDTAFGQGGKVITDMNRHGDGRAVALQRDGKIVVAGSGNSDAKMFNFALLRYNRDGSFDPTFGNGGIVLTPLGKDYDGANALAIQPDGKLVVAGQSSIIRGRWTLALRRYNADGSPDPTFVNGDLTNLTYGSVATAAVIQADGKIVVAGNVSLPDKSISSLVVRYHPDGSLDSSFGSGGQVITPVGTNDNISALAIQRDGKILAAGTTEGDAPCALRPCTFPSGMLLLRYLP